MKVVMCQELVSCFVIRYNRNTDYASPQSGTNLLRLNEEINSVSNKFESIYALGSG